MLVPTLYQYKLIFEVRLMLPDVGEIQLNLSKGTNFRPFALIDSPRRNDKIIILLTHPVVKDGTGGQTN
jgi:hypothetical protein